MDTDHVLKQPLRELTEANPMLPDFFLAFNIYVHTETHSFSELTEALPGSFWEEYQTSTQEITQMFIDYIEGLRSAEESGRIKSLEICAGIDKDGKKERCNLLLHPGEITCIIGPTGSGKSRLLADIEWFANADTPTKRIVLVNGKTADDRFIRTFGGRLIAQITQNMNFVLDMNVHEFLTMHAQSRLIENSRQKTEEVIELANELSGEQFNPQTPVTFLSGGQSRALMIADVACIGQAPIVLIDEIENAGVNKKKALELLVHKDKIVLMATHDPLLILLADKRVVIKNGGMDKILMTNETEKAFCDKLEQIDTTVQEARNFFRTGNQLSSTNKLLYF